MVGGARAARRHWYVGAGRRSCANATYLRIVSGLAPVRHASEMVLPGRGAAAQNCTMPTPAIPGVSSSYFLLRHGQSEANVQGLIASSPTAAYEGYGLTEVGRAQVRTSLIAALDAGTLPRDCQVVSSPLLRARESAAVAAEVLGTTVRVDPRLAERGFGEFELLSDEHYERVWTVDRTDPSHESWGVESTTSILSRVTALLRELHESDNAGTFLLCTHGDVASVTLCATQGLSLSQHREVGAMGNGEVRRLASSDMKGLSGFPRE